MWGNDFERRETKKKLNNSQHADSSTYRSVWLQIRNNTIKRTYDVKTEIKETRQLIVILQKNEELMSSNSICNIE